MLWAILGSIAANMGAGRSAVDEMSAAAFSERDLADRYADSRIAIAGESPSVNPSGSLVDLARILVSDDIKDDEVVVVADVFGNGTARIAQVVEPPRNARAARELDRAFHSDLAYAPFVPAGMDQRSNSVRVVFRMQSVIVVAD